MYGSAEVRTESPEESERHAPAHSMGGRPGADPLAGGGLGLITRSLVLRSGAKVGLLAGSEAPAKRLDVLCTWGTSAGRQDLLPPLPADGFVGRVLESERAVVEPLDRELAAMLSVAASGSTLTHVAGAAVRSPGGLTGVLCLGFTEPPLDPDEAIWLIEGYARLAAMSLHDAGMLDGLLAAARIDGLTGCLNHVAIRTELDYEIQRSARHGRSLSCCFIDLDRFKYLNDHHGHPYGSRVLAEVATLLRRDVRLGDTVGRYGGDEFVAVLPDTDERTACLLGSRLRELIATLALNGARVPLDASIGVAQWRTGWSADATLDAADAALLRAKGEGGGRVLGAANVISVKEGRFKRAGRPAY